MRALLWLLLAGCGGSEAVEHAAASAHTDGAYWTCPMHPSVHEDAPGQCPICGMSLVKVEAQETGAVRIDAERRAQYGIALEPAAARPMRTSIRLPAVVAWDQSRLQDVAVRVAGYVGTVGPAPGDEVRAGEVLFTLFSPELVSAQQDLLRAQAGPLADAARERLARWGVAASDVERVLRDGRPMEQVPFRAPRAGAVIERAAIDGASVAPGQTLFRLGDRSRVWLEAAVPQAQLPLVPRGAAVAVHGGDAPVAGTVEQVLPGLDPTTRTARVRVVLDNAAGALRPDQWVSIEVSQDAGERLAVPESAVLYTGPRRVVFVDIGEDTLAPREVRLGLRSDGFVEVLEGLQAGESVVVSGNFLVAADSRLRSGP